jgi:glycerophosphoryl diester phosphodiesterase
MMILGHRGMGELYKYPGNTLEAIKPVLGIGADGSEIDIQITKDSVVVLFHNKELDNRVNAKGKIFDKTWEEIKNVKYIGLQNDVKIISMDYLFSQIKDVNNYYFSLDCKLDDRYRYNEEYRKLFLRSIKRIIDKYQFNQHILLEGDLDFLQKAKELKLNIECFLTLEEDIDKKINDAKTNKLRGIGISLSSLTNNAVEKAHKENLYVMCWSSKNALENNKAFKYQVDIIQSDAPIHILQQLDRYNYDYQIP